MEVAISFSKILISRISSESESNYSRVIKTYYLIQSSYWEEDVVRSADMSLLDVQVHKWSM